MFNDKNRAVEQQLLCGKGKCWNKGAFVKNCEAWGEKKRRELAGDPHLNRKYI